MVSEAVKDSVLESSTDVPLGGSDMAQDRKRSLREMEKSVCDNGLLK